jgi:hypothetical protein
MDYLLLVVNLPCQVPGFGIPVGAPRRGYRGRITVYTIPDGVNHKSIRMDTAEERAAMREFIFQRACLSSG